MVRGAQRRAPWVVFKGALRVREDPSVGQRMDPHGLTVLLWTEETTAHIVPPRESRTPPSLSPSARRHDATGLAGGHISTLFLQVPHRALDSVTSHPQILLVQLLHYCNCCMHFRNRSSTKTATHTPITA